MMNSQSKTKRDMKSTGDFCGQTRREFIGNIAGGFASLALTGLLSTDGFLDSQAVAADGVTPYLNPLEPKPSHFTPKSKARDFLVHVWWPEPCRYLRLQADAVQAQR